MRILHLEDNPADSLLIQRMLQEHGLASDLVRAGSAADFRREIQAGNYNVVLVDNGVPGFDGLNAIRLSKQAHPRVPVIVCSGSATGEDVTAAMRAGASEYVDKHELRRLVAALHRAQGTHLGQHSAERLSQQHAAMSRLVGVVQELSLARDLQSVMAIVRRAARDLTNSDGATFVLREGERCFYADEDAISPLWKGKYFPLADSISGWSILNARPVSIEDVFSDPRIPVEAYRATFVKSLAMAPIRTAAPMGAIGVYWAGRHACTADELMLLEALANTTAVAMENVQVYGELESRVRSRTKELEVANSELEAFTYAVSHDLRAPVRALSGELGILLEESDKLDPRLKARLVAATTHVSRMFGLIDDLLRLSRITRGQLKIQRFDLGQLATEAMSRLRTSQPQRDVNVRIERGVFVEADPGLMSVLMENLLTNAWKYTANRRQATIEFRVCSADDGRRIFQVSDNGAGFDPRYAKRLFEPFQRAHQAHEFSGTGIGLATVHRIVRRHDGDVWGESEGPDRGATFSFTLGTRVKN
jgi:signal transduction histidine kinase/DNA-binding response OmpR family regulator